ncbi:MAG TPA: ribosomal-processing cysteine protease Prp [Bacilli bacterium]|nr:ribosomal-processing cysteine protease Prp [Bacilli bacterium]
MTKVYVKENNNIIKEITISGHSNNDVKGKDIVCSSISSIVTTTINALIRLDEEAISYTEKDGFININNIKNEPNTQILIDNMLNLLKELATKYPKNIQVKRGN